MPPALDDVVVIAAAEAHAAELDDPISRRRSAPYSGFSCSSRITPCAMLWTWRSWFGAGQVVEQQHGAVAAGEELLERQDLPAVAQRVARQQPQLRERIEHHARRLDPLHVRQDRLRRLAQLHLRRVEHRVLLVRPQAVLRRDQLADRDPVERPAVRVGHLAKLLLGLRERHVQDRLAAAGALQQELQRQRGLAGAGHAFDEVQPMRREAAAQNVVETLDAGGGATSGDRRRCARWCAHHCHLSPNAGHGVGNASMPGVGGGRWTRSPARSARPEPSTPPSPRGSGRRGPASSHRPGAPSAPAARGGESSDAGARTTGSHAPSSCCRRRT